MDPALVDGTRLRALRQKRRLSQIDLSRISGVDQGTISRLENSNQGDTRIDTLVQIARALGVSTDTLFVPAKAIPEEELTDPQLDVFMHLVEDMTPEECDSVEGFIRYVLYERRKKKPHRKRKRTTAT